MQANGKNKTVQTGSEIIGVALPNCLIDRQPREDVGVDTALINREGFAGEPGNKIVRKATNGTYKAGPEDRIQYPPAFGRAKVRFVVVRDIEIGQ